MGSNHEEVLELKLLFVPSTVELLSDSTGLGVEVTEGRLNSWPVFHDELVVCVIGEVNGSSCCGTEGAHAGSGRLCHGSAAIKLGDSIKSLTEVGSSCFDSFKIGLNTTDGLLLFGEFLHIGVLDKEFILSLLLLGVEGS